MQKCLNYGPGSPLEVKIKNNLAILVFFKELKNIIRSLKNIKNNFPALVPSYSLENLLTAVLLGLLDLGMTEWLVAASPWHSFQCCN